MLLETIIFIKHPVLLCYTGFRNPIMFYAVGCNSTIYSLFPSQLFADIFYTYILHNENETSITQ